MLHAKMIKAIIFNIGGVTHEESMKEHLSEVSKALPNSIKLKLLGKKKYQQAQTGKISDNDFLRLIAEKSKIKDFNKFKKIWIKKRERIIREKKEVISLIKKLKKKYIIGTLTNIINLHHKVRLKKKVYDHFKIKVVSCEVGTRKPNIKIYKLLIKKLKVSPEETIFIDNVKKNLLPARKLGIKTILFKNAEQLKKELRKLGVEV
jgi:epoxide hydrolase-like predicted phosphatase